MNSNAGINLTSYIPPGTPGLLHQNVCPAPGLLHNRKCPGAGPINDDVPGAGHLHQHKECYHSHLGLKIKLSECPTGPYELQKTRNAMSNCLFALGPNICPVTNVLLMHQSIPSTNIPPGLTPGNSLKVVKFPAPGKKIFAKLRPRGKK